MKTFFKWFIPLFSGSCLGTGACMLYYVEYPINGAILLIGGLILFYYTIWLTKTKHYEHNINNS